MHMRLLYNPQLAAKNNNAFQLHHQIINHVIALSGSPYRFSWFGQHFRPYDLSCKGFCMPSPYVCIHYTYRYFPHVLTGKVQKLKDFQALLQGPGTSQARTPLIRRKSETIYTRNNQVPTMHSLYKFHDSENN